MLEGTIGVPLFSSLPLKSRGQLIESEVGPHEDKELNKAPGSASVLSQGTSGFCLPTMDFSSLFTPAVGSSKVAGDYPWGSFTR